MPDPRAAAAAPAAARWRTRPRWLTSPAVLVAYLIVGTLCVRVALSSVLGLGIDESYMVAAGRSFRLGYFDHPPIAWWLAAGAARLAGDEAGWIVRLPFVALFAISTWLMYSLTARLFGARAGLWAAVTLNLAPVLSVTTGGWVLPDGPLVCALLAATLCLVHALDAEGSAAWRWWLAAGSLAGLSLLSKYTAALTLAGALVYLLTQAAHRRWLARPHPYAALGLAAAMFAPVLLWNAGHDWASFAFQGHRAVAHRLNLFGPLFTFGGEAVFLLPWLWLPMMLLLLAGLRAGPRAGPGWLLCCLAAGPILLFAVVSLWSRHVLFHWATPGYLFLFPLLGATVAELAATRRRLVRLWMGGSAAVVCLGLLVIGTEMRWHWLAAVWTGADPGIQAIDWTSLRPELDARGLLDRPGTRIAATSWSDAGKLDYGLGGARPVLCLNVDSRQYGLSPGPESAIGADVLIVAPRRALADIRAQYFGLFDAIESLPPAHIDSPGRMPTEVPLFLAYRLRAWP